MKCQHCEAETSNPKFCSRSCSTKFNNKAKPKRKPKPRHCSTCGKDFLISSHHYRSKRCPECFVAPQTVGEIRKQLHLKNKHPSWIHAVVRQRARHAHKDKPRICANCGYSLHVECCHIKPISSFPNEARVDEVNSDENVVLLCRNCHWEFDHGLLSL